MSAPNLSIKSCSLRQLLASLHFDLKKMEGRWNLDQTVSAVTEDSRQVVPGSVFVSIRGTHIQEAIQRGAILIVGEDPHADQKGPYLFYPDARQAIAQLAAEFYGNPSHTLQLIGVTGTSGKTTTSYLIESILKAAGHKVGVIGTVNFRVGDFIVPATHTTPFPVELQSTLALMKEKGCTAVVMEVSSHGLKQKRTAFVQFDGMVFTNLSPEHLDFHPDMEDYFQSKAILFKELAHYSIEQGKSPKAVINADNEYGKRLIDDLSLERSSLQVFPMSLKRAHLEFNLSGISGNYENVRISSSLTGKFNASNILAAVKLALALGISNEQISEGVKKLEGVPGRLERVPNSRGVYVWVDYAHKPDALQNVLQALQEVRGVHGKSEAKLITVFGCGGDRDRKKRPLMGKIAVQYSTDVIVTSDNPRTEDPQAIIDEILVEIQNHPYVKVEPDRRKAIFAAIQQARPGDLVLIAGKGHEDYQILGSTKIHFDDREVVKEAFLQPMLDMTF